jgi:hypothetical protein
MSLINNLPEELITKIYKIYYSENILNKIKNLRCFTDFWIDAEYTKSIKCNGNISNESGCFCENCLYGVINYYI